jgi:pimeloyl-ACP methyl ester carboxylesterase
MKFEQQFTSNLQEKNTDLKEQIERKKYELETGERIEVLSKEFSSKNDHGEQNVIFFPGWALSSEKSAVATLGQSFADKSKAKAYVISSRTESELGAEDVLLKEAEAISRFIKEKGLTNIILAGHSQGGDKAIDLVTILQNDPEINIHGLVLLDSMGLYDQVPGSLAKNFVKGALLDIPMTMVKKIVSNPDVVMRGLSAGYALTQGIFREISKSGITGWIKRTTNEVKLMAKINPRLAEVAVPIIIMSGSNDTISNPDTIIPPGEEERMIEEWEKKDETIGTSTYIDPREKFLQANVFPQSPYIRMVTPEKFGHHALPLLRAESVANASLYLLNRFERRKKTEYNST